MLPTRTNLIRNDSVAIINDLHLGHSGGPSPDEFDRDAEFVQFLEEILPAEMARPATLILAGDFLDFTQVLLPDARHRWGDRFGASQTESLDKLERVIASHPRVFDALAQFLDGGGQVLVLPGNHDIDLHWPAVFARLRAEVGAKRNMNLEFVSAGAIYERGLYVEHGNQFTHDNRFTSWENPILMAPDGERLERPWGTRFIEMVYAEMRELHPFLYRLSPRTTLTRVLIRGLFDRDDTSRRILARLAPFSFATGVPPLARRFLTRSNVYRLRRRLASLEAQVAVLAHTHRRLEGQRLCPSLGGPMVFNTGSWLRQYPIGNGEAVCWDDLRGRMPRHDLRYLAIELDDAPRAAMRPIRLSPTHVTLERKPAQRPAPKSFSGRRETVSAS